MHHLTPGREELVPPSATAVNYSQVLNHKPFSEISEEHVLATLPDKAIRSISEIPERVPHNEDDTFQNCVVAASTADSADSLQASNSECSTVTGNYCPYCNVKQMKIARHLQSRHKDEA